MRVTFFLESMGVNKYLVLWIKYFILRHTQRVWYNGQLSVKWIVNTGLCINQESVMSPILFSLYVNDFMIHNDNFKLFMYADNMALLVLLQQDDINASSEYMKHVEELLCWCKNSALILNLNKPRN